MESFRGWPAQAGLILETPETGSPDRMIRPLDQRPSVCELRKAAHNSVKMKRQQGLPF